MLYKLSLAAPSVPSLDPVPFSDFSSLGGLEKDLEAAYAGHLLDLLFEETPLMPIFRERQRQAEADLYALNAAGDLVIFEFKLGSVGGEAVHQILRYAQDAGRWSFQKLATKYDTYARATKRIEHGLAEAHRQEFELDRPLAPHEFNRRQHLWLVGNAADEDLTNGVEYWRSQGVSIQFVPYRIYTIGNGHYFEVFSPPYDRHSNPGETKGVLFDTNSSYDKDAIWHMLEKRRVSAFGDTKYVADYLNPRDIVFLSHKGHGIVAAGEVVGPRRIAGPTTKPGSEEEWYHDLKLLTKIPAKSSGVAKAMSFAQVTAATGKSFFWARTVKVPYLKRDEADSLLAKVLSLLGPPDVSV